jgi:hypothetical protein
LLPQIPQLALSVCLLTQVPLHRDEPAVQAHVPLWQVWPPVHAPQTVPEVPHIEVVWLL